MIISTFWVKPWRRFSSPHTPSPPHTEPGISTSDILSWIKQEEETQVGAPQEPKESDMCKGTYAGEYQAAQAQSMSDHWVEAAEEVGLWRQGSGWGIRKVGRGRLVQVRNETEIQLR